jgi:PKD repeat protein
MKVIRQCVSIGLAAIIILSLAVAAPLATIGLNTTIIFANDTEVNFSDTNLETAIREAIAKPGGPIYSTDLLGLTELWASGREITDLTGLEYCTDLTELYLDRNQISDITPLSALTSLEYLILPYNQISDLTPLSNLTSLTQLFLSTNQISNISPLTNLTSLVRLELESNQISDVAPLSSLTNLEYLRLNYNQISDIAPLSSLTNLTSLVANGNQISDIMPISNLTNLTGLILSDNQLVDIAPLSSLNSLIWVQLQDNQISDIDALSGLTTLGALLLDNNLVTDISALSSLTNLGDAAEWMLDRRDWQDQAHYVCLGLQNNLITDITLLVNNAGLDDGDEIDLRDNSLDDNSYDMLIPQLEGRGVTVLYERNEPPEQPTNISPAEEATGVSVIPSLQSSAFSDPDMGDTHAASQWQVTDTSGDYSSPLFDSGEDTNNLTSIVIPQGELLHLTTYYWRVRHQDSYGSWSEWSAETSFTTTSLTATPDVAFSGTPASGMAPLTVEFTDQSTGNVTSWKWDFNNDGSIDSMVQNPSYIYQTAGTYTVSLMVTGPGGSDTEIKSDYITVTTTALKAAFSVDKTSSTVPLTVKFTDESTGNVTLWEWDFNNDGEVDSVERNPSYNYETTGEYSVSLKVTGPDGSDTELKSEYITVEEAPSGGIPAWVWIVIGIGAAIIVAGGAVWWFRFARK